jgi:hypothetical protein
MAWYFLRVIDRAIVFISSTRRTSISGWRRPKLWRYCLDFRHNGVVVRTVESNEMATFLVLGANSFSSSNRLPVNSKDTELMPARLLPVPESF